MLKLRETRDANSPHPGYMQIVKSWKEGEKAARLKRGQSGGAHVWQ